MLFEKLANKVKVELSFTKVAQLGILFEIITQKVKVKMSFGHKAVILSFSKSKNFVCKSFSDRHAI